MVVADEDQAADGVAVAAAAAVGAAAMVEGDDPVSWEGGISALGAPCPASPQHRQWAMSRRTEQPGW